MIQNQAVSIYESIIGEEDSEKTFKACNGWFNLCNKRNRIKNIAFSEAANAEADAASDDLILNVEKPSN